MNLKSENLLTFETGGGAMKEEFLKGRASRARFQ